MTIFSISIHVDSLAFFFIHYKTSHYVLSESYVHAHQLPYTKAGIMHLLKKLTTPHNPLVFFS